MSPRSMICSLALLLALVWALPALAQEEPKVEAKLIPSQEALAQGTTVPLAIRLIISKGLHINSPDTTSPDVFPTQVQLSAPKGISFSELTFPRPKMYKFEFLAEELPVFEGTVDVLTLVKVAPDAPLGPQKIVAKIGYQGCLDNVCLLPAFFEVELTIEVVPAGTMCRPMNPEVFKR